MDAAVKASDAISTGNSEVPDKVLHDKDEESPSKARVVPQQSMTKPSKPSKVDAKTKVDAKKPSAKEIIPPPKKKQSDLQLPWGILGVLAVVVAILAVVVYSRPPHVYNKSAPKAQTRQETQVKTQKRQETQTKTQQRAEATVTTSAAVPKGANAEGKPREADKSCNDRYPQCIGFQRQGECEKNPGWMIMNCPSSCNSCSLRDPKLRCDRNFLNISTEPIYNPGDMDMMFRNAIVQYAHYGVEVLSSPDQGPGKPWIVTFENFVSDEQVDALIATNTKFERSTDTGSSNEFGETGRILSQSRTSSNSWCRGECESHPSVNEILRNIAAVTGVPKENYESFQVLKYEVGQRYGVHHDYGSEDRKLACGPRILTFFLYLSDVEEGGETAFPNLNIAVKPKKGKALLWPSVLNNDPNRQEPATMHEARPVIKGLKYAANSWIHLYNYEVPNLWGCTGTFDELSE